MRKGWQKDFFQGVALEMWRRAMPAEVTRTEADFLEKALEVAPGAALLDVPCGNGRHAAVLAARGYRMTGLDLSEEYVHEARAAAPDGTFVGGDMCSLPWTAAFDAAYCFGNSFGYLDREDARQFLRQVCRALRPGARFAVEMGTAAESILPSLIRNRWFRLGDLLMLSENRYDPAESRLDIDYTFVHEGKIETRPAACYVYTVAELRGLHREAGLDPSEMFGSAAGEPYQLGSARLILVSRKTLET